MFSACHVGFLRALRFPPTWMKHAVWMSMNVSECWCCLEGLLRTDWLPRFRQSAPGQLWLQRSWVILTKLHFVMSVRFWRTKSLKQSYLFIIYQTVVCTYCRTTVVFTFDALLYFLLQHFNQKVHYRNASGLNFFTFNPKISQYNSIISYMHLQKVVIIIPLN